MKPMTIYMLEGTWWSSKETPQLLPYIEALQNSEDKIQLSYRTIRNKDDIEYWISKIKKNEHAFLYISCHAEKGSLYPVDDSEITNEEFCATLNKAKEGAIDFLHISACDMIGLGQKGRPKRTDSLEKYHDASKAKWVSGYSDYVGWLPSTLLDMALISELAVPHYADYKQKKTPRLSIRAETFIKGYSQLARSLKFSGAYYNDLDKCWMFPKGMSKK